MVRPPARPWGVVGRRRKVSSAQELTAQLTETEILEKLFKHVVGANEPCDYRAMRAKFDEINALATYRKCASVARLHVWYVEFEYDFILALRRQSDKWVMEVQCLKENQELARTFSESIRLCHSFPEAVEMLEATRREWNKPGARHAVGLTCRYLLFAFFTDYSYVLRPAEGERAEEELRIDAELRRATMRIDAC
jgi:hypothetical protein